MFATFFEKNRDLAPLVIRLGLAIVFFLFGLHKLSSPAQTTSEIQFLLEFLGLAAASAMNFYLGLTEVTIAFALLAGKYTRFFAFVAAGMTTLFFTSFIIKLGASINPDIYRDIGLTAAALALVFLGGGKWSWDTRKKSEPFIQ